MLVLELVITALSAAIIGYVAGFLDGRDSLNETQDSDIDH